MQRFFIFFFSGYYNGKVSGQYAVIARTNIMLFNEALRIVVFKRLKASEPAVIKAAFAGVCLLIFYCLKLTVRDVISATTVADITYIIIHFNSEFNLLTFIWIHQQIFSVSIERLYICYFFASRVLAVTDLIKFQTSTGWSIWVKVRFSIIFSILCD